MTTTTVPELMTRQATVAEASQVAGRDGSTQWALKLEIADISKFPVPCYMPLERAAQVLKGSAHIVTMRRGKVKQGKEGKYASEFFWDLTHWDVQAPPTGVADVAAPKSPSQAPAAQPSSATERPQTAAPPAPVPWDAADTQSRISWAQAVNLAVETLGLMDQAHPASYIIDVEVVANRFYPLIRKGPTPQEGDIDPETLPFDAPQGPQKGQVYTPISGSVTDTLSGAPQNVMEVWPRLTALGLTPSKVHALFQVADGKGEVRSLNRWLELPGNTMEKAWEIILEEASKSGDNS